MPRSAPVDRFTAHTSPKSNRASTLSPSSGQAHDIVSVVTIHESAPIRPVPHLSQYLSPDVFLQGRYVRDIAKADGRQTWGVLYIMYVMYIICLLYTSPSPRDGLLYRMP